MMIRAGGTAVAIAVAGMVGAQPAFADPPTGSDGCTFDRGQTTCVSTITSYVTEGPYSGEGHTHDGTVAGELCSTVGHPAEWGDAVYYKAIDAYAVYRVTTTTTTVTHGAPNSHGALVSTETKTDKQLFGPMISEPDDLICGYNIPG